MLGSETDNAINVLGVATIEPLYKISDSYSVKGFVFKQLKVRFASR